MIYSTVAYYGYWGTPPAALALLAVLSARCPDYVRSILKVLGAFAILPLWDATGQRIIDAVNAAGEYGAKKAKELAGEVVEGTRTSLNALSPGLGDAVATGLKGLGGLLSGLAGTVGMSAGKIFSFIIYVVVGTIALRMLRR